MKTEYQYIQFDIWTSSLPERKTKRWNCLNIRGRNHLGVVEWSGAWRQYIFAPAQSTIFSASCLADIQDFIKQAMTEHKAKP